MKAYIHSIFLIALCSACSVTDSDFVRTIYYAEPKRTDDIVLDEKYETRPLPLAESGAFVPEETLVVITPEDQTVSNNVFSSFKLSDDKVSSIAALAPGRAFVGTESGGLYSVQIDRNQPRAIKYASGKQPIVALSVSNNGRYVAVSQFSVVTVLDVDTFKIVAQLTRVKGRILSLAWSPDDSLLLLGRTNGDIFGWSLGDEIKYAENSTSVLSVYETEISPVQQIVVHPSGRALFAALENGSLYSIRLISAEVDLGLRELGSAREITRGTFVSSFGNNGRVAEMTLSSDARTLYVLTQEGVVYPWAVRGLRALFPLELGDGEIGTARLIRKNELSVIDQDLLATVGRDLRLRVRCLNPDLYAQLRPTSQIYETEKKSLSKLNEDEEVSSMISELRALSRTRRAEREKKHFSSRDKALILDSNRFRDSITALDVEGRQGTSLPTSNRLWLGTKSGILTYFNISRFLENIEKSVRISDICR